MGVFKAILSVIFGGALKYILTVALIATGAAAWWSYSMYRDATEELDQYKFRVELLVAERKREKVRLENLVEIAAEREERRKAWQSEALKWKNQRQERIEANEDVRHWAHSPYRGQLTVD